MARKFLYIIAALIVVVFAGRVALTFWAGDLSAVAFTPRVAFEPQPPLAPDAYTDPKLWHSRPGVATSPANRLPQGTKPGEPLAAAVFFIPPTSYLNPSHWNAPMAEPTSDRFADAMLAASASAFNASGQLWIPRYRQATFGAFLTDKPERLQALDAAYGDVRQAFGEFLAHLPPDQPIILAGHSQGALHLKRLLKEEAAGKPLMKRIVAAYVIGWPVWLTHDLPQMGLPACTHPDQAGCVVSWMSFADPAETKQLREMMGRFRALDGQAPEADAFLCSNPLNGTIDSAASANANRGTLLPVKNSDALQETPGIVPAHCSADHFLHIGPLPELGSYVLPGNNTHVYDYALFWENIRLNATQREAAWRKHL